MNKIIYGTVICLLMGNFLQKTLLADSKYLIKKERSPARTIAARQQCCEAFAQLLTTFPLVRSQLTYLQRNISDMKFQCLLADVHDSLSSLELLFQQLIQDFIQGNKKGLWNRPTKERLTIVSTRITALEKLLTTLIGSVKSCSQSMTKSDQENLLSEKKISLSSVITPKLHDILSNLKNDLKFFEANNV